MNDMGATSPGLWQVWQFFCSNGRMSLLNVVAVSEPAAAAIAAQARLNVSRRMWDTPPLISGALSYFITAYWNARSTFPGNPPHPVPGVCKHHAVCDHRTGRIERSALATHAIDSLVFAHGVEIPDHLAGLRLIS